MRNYLLILIILLSTISVSADDRALFGLRGPVKSATFSTRLSYIGFVEELSDVFEFSPEGEWQYFSNNEKKRESDDVKIYRKDGEIIATVRKFGDYQTEKIIWEMTNIRGDEYVSTFTLEEPDIKHVYYLTYDNGNLFCESARHEGKDWIKPNCTEVVYKVLEHDKYGNWIKRKAVYNRSDAGIETCKIEYYPEEMIPRDISKVEDERVPVIVEEEVIKPKVDDNAVYADPETKPAFPGGTAAIFRHIAKTMRYPLIAQENGKQGKVTVSFIVEKDGTLSNLKVSIGVDPNLDKEALRVIKILPKFTPGKINGKPVRTSMNLPVTFKLN